jgi:UDP-N-acetylmuramate: L-alanyl-gamma-D-glutamyl-meso-diaminopimelate ligase
MNIMGAWDVCKEIGVKDEDFISAIKEFKGASNRLELIAENENTKVFKDFAHSPSKLKATSSAVKLQYKDRKLIAVMELHTFSSLTFEFLMEYNGAMDKPDVAIVYFNPHTIEHKKLEPITVQDVKEAFNRPDLMVFTKSEDLQNYLQKIKYNQTNLLLMSSGNFDGMDLKDFAQKIVGQ